MSLSHEAAIAALHDIDDAASRSVTLNAYNHAAPHLILWGGLWFAGYSATYLAPSWNPLIWTGIGIGGSVLDGVIASRMKGAGSEAERAGTTGLVNKSNAWILMIAAIAVFVVATVAVMQPTDPRQMAAFIPLIVALTYVLTGLAFMPRLACVGAVLAGLTLLGYFAWPAMFMPWMAVVGGGTLVLSGLWLRRV